MYLILSSYVYKNIPNWCICRRNFVFFKDERNLAKHEDLKYVDTPLLQFKNAIFLSKLLGNFSGDERTIDDRMTRLLGLKGPRSTKFAFAITVVSPFTDSPDCLIIPRSAITPISISSRFAGALYNHSGTAVRESSVSENWTRETFSKLVTFHADTSLVSYFAFTRLPGPPVFSPFTLPIPFPSLLPLSLRPLRLLRASSSNRRCSGTNY